MISRFDSVVWITSLIAATMAIVITVVFPIGYFVISYQYMKGTLDTHAESAARTTERLVMANPNTWQFEEIRLQELLRHRPDRQIPELRSILDIHGNVVAHMMDPLSPPLVRRRCDIYDAGAIVGQVEVSRSLRPLLIRTAFVGAVSSLAGYCIFLILRILPLRALRAEQLKRQELEAQNRQLQKAESLSRMAGAIAHHFNNQLSVVMGNLELTLEYIPRGDMLLENLTQAMKAARKAAEVSSLMLTYLGQTTARQEPMDICEACNRSLPLLRTTLPGTILLETDLPSPGPTINGNASQIQQVLTNLVTNAKEAIGNDRGRIHLNIKTVSTENIPRSYRRPIEWHPQGNGYACLEVRDSGCGIAQEDIEKIFDPFFTTKFTGRGLGLAVVLGVLRSHDGAITVESEPGRGSIFRVFLPVSAEAVARLPEKAAKAPEIEGGETVLLVEDEEPVRKMTMAMLTRLGFTALAARDGLEAVEEFRRHRDEIHFVLCDLTMPRMNGWETLAALRTLSPGLPVILASGYDEAQVMAGDHSEQPDAFLHKPFSMKELATAIRKVLAQVDTTGK